MSTTTFVDLLAQQQVQCQLYEMVVTFSVTNIFQTPNRGSSDNGNSRHLIPDSPICTSSHFMIFVDLNAQGDDPVSYKVCAHRTECIQLYDSHTHKLSKFPKCVISLTSYC